jgi:hypothetical protein
MRMEETYAFTMTIVPSLNIPLTQEVHILSHHYILLEWDSK